MLGMHRLLCNCSGGFGYGAWMELGFLLFRVSFPVVSALVWLPFALDWTSVLNNCDDLLHLHMFI